MRLWIGLMMLTTVSFPGSAGTELVCSLLNSKRVIAIAEKHSTYDKNRHCTVSCMLALKCDEAEVLIVGTLKEIKDFFGPGNADREDLKADAFGIKLATKGAAKNDRECLSQCDLYYQQ